MSGTTPNLNLAKPGENGTADIKVIDQNMEKIDAWAGEKETELSGKEPKFNKKSGFNLDITHLINSTSKILVASAYAVKLAYDRGSSGVTKADNAQTTANAAQTKANQAYTLAEGKEPKFNKKSGFNLDITHLINSTSKILLASAYAVKLAYDKGIEALGLANTNKNAIQNNIEQIENLFGFTTTNSEKNLDLGMFKMKIKQVIRTGPADVVFETPFVNECFGVMLTDEGNGTLAYQRVNSFNKNGFNISTTELQDKFRYFAIGY